MAACRVDVSGFEVGVRRIDEGSDNVDEIDERTYIRLKVCDDRLVLRC